MILGGVEIFSIKAAKRKGNLENLWVYEAFATQHAAPMTPALFPSCD